MKKHYSFLPICFLLIAGLFLVCGITACGDKKDEPKSESILTVSPTSLLLLSDKGSAVNFSITTRSEWTISGCPDWLTLSATAGNGNANITATALTTNASAKEREALLTITTDDNYMEVSIKQLASLVSDCAVGFKDILCMTTSVAFKYDIESKVSYFYAAYLSASAAGWTDERIIKALTSEDRFDPNNASDTGLNGFGAMAPNTEYYLCAVGFNEKGEQGELTRTKIKTLKSESQVPIIYIDDVGYNSSKWLWSTNPNSYTAKYYMLFTDGDYADVFGLLLTEAEVAWIMKDGISNGKYNPIATGGDWNGPRESGANSIYIATWGVNVENTYSPFMREYYGTIKNKAPRREISRQANTEKKSYGVSEKLLQDLQIATKVLKK